MHPSGIRTHNCSTCVDHGSHQTAGALTYLATMIYKLELEICFPTPILNRTTLTAIQAICFQEWNFNYYFFCQLWSDGDYREGIICGEAVAVSFDFDFILRGEVHNIR